MKTNKRKSPYHHNEFRPNKRKYVCPACQTCNKKFLHTYLTTYTLDTKSLQFFGLSTSFQGFNICKLCKSRFESKEGEQERLGRTLQNLNYPKVPLGRYRDEYNFSPYVLSHPGQRSNLEVLPLASSINEDGTADEFQRQEEIETDNIGQSRGRPCNGTSYSTINRIFKEVKSIILTSHNSCNELKWMKSGHCSVSIRSQVKICINGETLIQVIDSDQDRVESDITQLPDNQYSITDSLKLKLQLGLSHTDYQTLRNQTKDLLQPLQKVIDEFKTYEANLRQKCFVTTNEGKIDGIYFTPQSTFENHMSDYQNLVDTIKCTKIWSDHIVEQDQLKQKFREVYQKERERMERRREDMKREERKKIITRMKKKDTDPLTLDESAQVDSELRKLFPETPSTKDPTNQQQQFFQDLGDTDYLGSSKCLKVEYNSKDNTLYMTTLCRFSGDGHIFMGKSGSEYVMLMGFPASTRSQCVDNYEIIGQFKIEDKKVFVRKALHYVNEHVNNFQNTQLETIYQVKAGDLKPEVNLEVPDTFPVNVRIRVHCILACEMKGYEQLLNKQLKQLKQFNPWDDATVGGRKREFDYYTPTTVDILNDPECNPFNWRVIDEDDLFFRIVTFPDRPPDTMHKQNRLCSHFIIVLLGIAGRRGVKLKSTIVKYLYSIGVVRKSNNLKEHHVKLDGRQSWKILQQESEEYVIKLLRSRSDNSCNLNEYDIRNLEVLWMYYRQLFYALNPEHDANVEAFKDHLLTYEEIVRIARIIDSLLDILSDYMNEFDRIPYYLHVLKYNLVCYLSEWYTLYPMNLQTHERINGILNDLWENTPRTGGKCDVNIRYRTESGGDIQQNNIASCIMTVITSFKLKKQWRLFGTEDRIEFREERRRNNGEAGACSCCFKCLTLFCPCRYNKKSCTEKCHPLSDACKNSATAVNCS